MWIHTEKALKAGLSRCTCAAMLWEGGSPGAVGKKTQHVKPTGVPQKHWLLGDVAGMITSRGEFSGGSPVTTHIPAPLGEARGSDRRWLPGSGALGGSGK